MANLETELANKTARIMLSWLASWGQYIAGENKNAIIGHWDDSRLLNAADLLVDYGVFKESNRCYFSLETTHPQLSASFNLEDIIYTFFDLGSFYGFGVKFKEQGFKVEKSLAELFANLVSLGFCKQDESFYFWTEKTYRLRLSEDGSEIFVPSLENYRQQMRDSVFSNKEAVRLLGKLDVPPHYWDNDELLEQFVFQRIDSWRDKPVLWPDSFESI